nr:ribonuclease H-like domain-containing protein [Tanacetum cinerariifolium]
MVEDNFEALAGTLRPSNDLRSPKDPDRQFTKDSNCTIEFDAFDFSMNDFLTRHILFRCNRLGHLYPVTKLSTLTAAFMSTSSTTWHQCLDHPRDEVLRSLSSLYFISCNKEKSTYVFHACQLGKYVKLPFHSSHPIVQHCFDIIRSDLWTSPIQLGVDFDETFSPVVKPTTIRMVLSLVVSRQWPIHQLDVKNSFLNSDLSEMLYMHQPPRFVDSRSQQLGVDFDETFSPVVKPTTIRMVLSLVVSRQWPIHQLDVKNSFLNSDLSEMVYMHQPPRFVDSRYPNHIIDSLHKEFDMTDLGALNYFLGISAVLHSTWLFLYQKKYALELLARAHMVNCNLSMTPVESKAKLGPDRVPVQDPTLYRSLAGGL